jgi:ATP synthase F1 complex assembly factor 2
MAVRAMGAVPETAGGYVRRFYKKVDVRRAELGFEVMLDKRTLRTPSRQPMCLPTLPLALAIALEWQVQGPYLKPFTMPLTQFSSTALDMPLTLQRPFFCDRIVSFLHSDTACYRVPHGKIRDLQNRYLDPVLAHVMEKYSLEMKVNDGMDLYDAKPEIVNRMREVLEGVCDFELVALETAVTATKSVTIALCLLDGHLSIKEALRCSRTEEDSQADLYGRVEGHHDIEEAQTLMLLAAARVLPQLHKNLS